MRGDRSEIVRTNHTPGEPDGADEERSLPERCVFTGEDLRFLSHTMRELEESLGVRLLNRTTRSVAPTEAGQRLLTRLRPLFDEFETAVDSVNAFRDRPAGQLRITVPPPA